VSDTEFTDLPWEVMRCKKCDRVLLKRTCRQPLRPGERIAVKCRACAELNMMIGAQVMDSTSPARPAA
jgi:RNase P subunit RPR2